MRKLLLIFLLGITYTLCLAQFGGGEGTSLNPYQVETAEHLNNVRNFLNAYFIQRSDINLSEYENWVPIGSDDNRFTGSFNGGGYLISNMFINREEDNHQGLFGYTEEAVLENIILVDVDVTADRASGGLVGYNRASTISDCNSSGSVRGFYRIGGLVGCNWTSTISNSHSTGTVTGDQSVGGLVGGNNYHSTINNSYSTARVIGTGQSIGGLVGYDFLHSTITNSYSSGIVTGGITVGGLVGFLDDSTIINSYSQSDVEGDMFVGGLAAVNYSSTVRNCYSVGRVAGNQDIGGLIGHELEEGEVIDSYWNIETSGQVASNGGTARTTRQMTYPYEDNTYARWDFDLIWAHDIEPSFNNRYPRLYYQVPELPDAPEITVEIITINDTAHIRLSWELVEDALSYFIYTSLDPYAEGWGEPAAIVGENINNYQEPLNDDNIQFYRVTASTEEAP